MDATKALPLIQDSFYRGRYFIDPHALKRMKQRNIGYQDIKHAVMNATDCRPYSDPDHQASPGATSWRVSGVDFEGDRLDVGVDLVLDHLGWSRFSRHDEEVNILRPSDQGPVLLRRRPAAVCASR
ncbi:MAG: DUF4258 domain-containing protein [Myxococcales bacterium]